MQGDVGPSFVGPGFVDTEFTAFIGRDRELGELRALASGARALTLCGAGGIGKTRLAMRVVGELAPAYPDGAWFVELADLHQPDLVASRIASVIGVSEEPGRPQLATLADALRPRRLLLCLDTCEHLIEACAQICQRLLASAPGLRVIATSREPLRVAAETVWQVPPLSLPAARSAPAAPSARSAAQEVRPEPIADSDALRLFADRAAAAKPGFALTVANLAWVTRICSALDGLPLGIELAAAWVRVLTVEQIAIRLADRFQLLNSADRTAPARHRTLRAAIDWSHDLLSPPEKILLRRLSVFADWPLEMAEKVCARADIDPAEPGSADPAPLPEAGQDELAGPSVLDLLTGLSDKSLVIAEADSYGKIRYRMLDTIREYAAARLAEAGEADALHRRFRLFTVRETEDLAMIGMARVPAPWSSRVDAIQRFETESANLRQVLGRALDDGDIESGLRICSSMRPVWIIQGSFAEGTNWLDQFLAVGRRDLDAEVFGAALVSRAQLAMATDPDEVREYATAGLELCKSDESRFWAASALNLLAEVALHARQLDDAAARANEALAVARPAGDRWNEGYAAGTLAAAAAFRGEIERAKELAETALAITREIDQQWGAARGLMGLGDLARLTGRLDQARQYYTEALTIVREISAKPEIARCLAGLGRIAVNQGDLASARRHLGESLTLSQSTGSRIGVIRGLDAFAEMATGQGDPESALQLAAAAAALRRQAGLPEAPASRLSRVMDAAADLGEDKISSLWAAGSALSGEAAVAFALSGPVGHPEPREPDQHYVGRDEGPQQDGQAVLTARELQVARLIVGGASNRAIGRQLGIATSTVARHVANIMAKLEVNTRAQIAAWVLAQPGGAADAHP
ncbi:MAG TPA: tetratricopeptide repeat protein [Streptosporangiaceae bacterium]|nr:tetratricopeptide repeat protein [Streptosporangiaceae bacterium]